ncbi:hypothetical protein [Kutzneria chonburiensis]|uniref:Minor tail protein n=1 Tax=Kutzneria chonburiensis TaxID=1483604 RepID=A0ABV6N3C6_9PSEU|nr:hypothetical protein [Kutzneria chonburiensis]
MDVQYRVLFTALKTGVPVAELPCSDLKFSVTITAPGSASFTTPLHGWDPAIDLQELLMPLRAGVYVLRNGFPVWGGILTTWTADLSAETLSLDCQGLWEYVKGLVLQETKDYQQVDQASILAGLLGDVQSFYGMAPDRVSGSTVIHGAQILNSQHRIPATGRLRDRTYNGYETKDLDNIVSELSAVIDGFDFRVDFEWCQHNDPSRPAVFGEWFVKNHVQLIYPNTGWVSDIVLRHGDNCEVGQVRGDGTGMATRGIATGDGEGDDMLIARSTNSVMEKTFPPFAHAESYSDVSDLNTLQDKANLITSMGVTPVVLPEVTLHPDSFPSFDQIQVGRVVVVEAASGALALSDAFKVVQIDVELTEPGQEVIKLSMSPSSLPLSILPPSLAAEFRRTHRRLLALERSRRSTISG